MEQCLQICNYYRLNYYKYLRIHLRIYNIYLLKKSMYFLKDNTVYKNWPCIKKKNFFNLRETDMLEKILHIKTNVLMRKLKPRHAKWFAQSDIEGKSRARTGILVCLCKVLTIYWCQKKIYGKKGVERVGDTCPTRLV